MSDPFIGEIRMVGFDFPPRGWAFANGQTLPIANNTALFSLYGTTYGGDGRTDFQLPDLRGRAPLNSGNGQAGPGLSPYHLGQYGGVDDVVLSEGQIPSHTHVAVLNSTGAAASSDIPEDNTMGNSGPPFYNAGQTPNTTLHAESVTVDNAGGGQSHSNLQPYLAILFCVSLEGIYPSRS
jgi:microcystin-dependent protein